MPTFERGSVVSVPFPYTNRDSQPRRPALIVSDGDVGAGRFLLWVVMITSAEHRPWPGDVRIEDAAGAGLAAPSIVRTAKIANIERAAAEYVGHVGAPTLAEVYKNIKRTLGLA